MDSGPSRSRPGAMDAILSGLEAGMLGVLWMLAWLGVSAVWGRLTFWTSENLMATAFYGEGALRRGFSSHTISGMALYLLIYSTLGALFALALRDRLTYARTVIAGVLVGLAWHYVSYHLIGRAVMPLAALLHPERQTVVGHVLWGAVAGRFRLYLGREDHAQPATVETPAEIADPETPPPAAELPAAEAGAAAEPGSSDRDLP